MGSSPLAPTVRTSADLVRPFLELAEREPAGVWAFGPAQPQQRGASRERILATAAGLRALGHGAGTVCALVLEPIPASVEALAAVWCAGLVPVLIDPALSAGAELAIAERLGARLAWRPDAGSSLPVPVEPVQPAVLEGAAAVKLTSGSTGDPQGVVVSAAALFADTEALVRCMRLDAGHRALVAVPLSHSYGFSVLTLPALTHGVPLVFAGEEGALAAARRHGATFLPSVPAWYQSIARTQEADALPPALRLLVSAGSPLAPAVARGFRERFARPIHILYGASECGSIAFDREGGAAERGRIGTLLDGVSIELRPPEGVGDADRGGELGLVLVRSPALASGYLPADRPGAERLTRDYFRTEDLARWTDGELELCGRESEWINVKGHKVDPRAVERVIAQHPRVDEVAVLGKPIEGGHEQTVRAVIACAPEGLGFLELLDWCRPRLAPYQLPRSVAFVRALPRTERGKLDRARLLAL